MDVDVCICVYLNEKKIEKYIIVLYNTATATAQCKTTKTIQHHNNIVVY